MNLEAGEEAFDPVEEFDKHFAARDRIFCCLREKYYYNSCRENAQ